MHVDTALEPGSFWEKGLGELLWIQCREAIEVVLNVCPCRI